MSNYLKKGQSPLEIEGFEWIGLLGRGGFAETHLYTDLNQKYGEKVAIKVPHDEDMEEHLIRGDLSSLATLRDLPHIVRMLDIIRVQNRYVLLMEYAKGKSLRELLGPPGAGAQLTPRQAVAYSTQIATGLAAAHHRRMVHRDIKPENIIIEETTNQALILDFGIASLTDTKGVFKTTSKRHTPTYTPAEVLFEGKGDHRVDIYGLGMTLFEMLTGTLPYYEADGNWMRPILVMREQGPPSLKEYNPRVPKYLENIVHQAIAPDLANRYSDMASFLTALEPPPEIRIAQEHAAAGSIKRAERILKSLVEREPNDSRALTAMAAFLNRIQHPAEACEILRRAIALDPEEPDHHWRLGVTLNQMNKKTEALECLNHAALIAVGEQKMQKKILSMIASLS